MRQQTWDPYDRACPSREVLNGIADRWAILVIGALADGPLRYGAIAQRVGGVSPKMLSQTLRKLDRDGLVHRMHYAQIPPRVDYELTEAGRSLLVPLQAVADWARNHTSAVLAAQQEYDAKA